LSMHIFHAYLLKTIVAATLAAALAWIGVEWGQRLLEITPLQNAMQGYERVSTSGALGLAFISWAVLLLGALRCWYAAVFAGGLGALALTFIFHPAKRGWHREEFTDERAAWSPVWKIVLTLFFLAFLLGESSPEIFYDALFYHIAVPNLYRLAHRIYDTPTSLFSNYVLNIQRLYGLALTLWNENAAKFLHGAMAVLLGCGMVGFTRRYFSRGAGWLAAVFFFSMPFVGINVITTGIDVGWSFFQFAAGAALIGALLERGRPQLWLAGFLGGISAGCKYPAFTYLPVSFLILIWARRRAGQPWRAVAQDAAEFTAAATLALLPLFAKNILFHGNPVYPIAGIHWGTPRILPHYWKIFQAEATLPDLREIFSHGQSALQFLLHPWMLTMRGNSNGDFVGPLYLMALPFLYILRAPSPAFLWTRRYVTLLWCVWLVTSTSPRYGLPILALFAPLLAESCVQLATSPGIRFALFGMLFVGSLQNLYEFTGVLFTLGGWQVVGGLVSKNDYLSRMQASYPTPPYAGILWMNEHLPAQATVLFVGEARNYYMQRPAIPFSVHDPEPLMQWSHEAASPAALRQKLSDEKISYLYLNLAEAMRNRGYEALHWNAEEWRTMNGFWNRYVELAWKLENNENRNPQYQYVYRLLSEEEAARPHVAPPNPLSQWAELPK
jgi:hypothetical protein